MSGKVPVVKETFLGFISTADAAAAVLTRSVSDFLITVGLDIKK